MACAVRELHDIKEFKATFCLETIEEKLHVLTLNTEKAVAAGLYDFLPRPPLVFSRTVAWGFSCYYLSRRTLASGRKARSQILDYRELYT